MKYCPKPLDTSNIQLTPELVDLLEKLAENTHEVWAQNRLNDGWSYGRTRDDEKKLHPCLVPYDQLPESEKNYDRSTSSEVLKAICTLGYRISKN